MGSFPCINFFINEYFQNFNIIVLFQSLRNCKRRKKGNFMLKYNSNKIMLCGGGGQHYFVLNKID